jgi:hypothetical protein
VAVIGAPGNGSSPDGTPDDEWSYGPGAAYVFQYTAEAWGEETKLTAFDGAPDDEFGYSVSISGDAMVIGAPWAVSTEFSYGPGAAYVYRYSDGTWGFEQKLTASVPGVEDKFGFSVSILGDTIVVGAHLDDGKAVDAGAAHVFSFNGLSWAIEDKLLASDGLAGDQFGFSVTQSSDTIAIGAKRHDGKGAAYVFGWDGANWVEDTKLTASDGATGGRFGHSVAISSENTILIGAVHNDMKGSAYAFSNDGATWNEDLKFIAPIRGTNYFGTAVAISGDDVLIGCLNDNDDKGAAYVSTVSYTPVPEPSLLALNLAALATLVFVARRRTSM